MIYDIQTKNDFSSGYALSVRFPEADLDKKALYTLLADRPEFIVPFRYVKVDGMIECTYSLEGCGKLQYDYATRSPKEYVCFWNGVLRPLIDCADWFLTPYAFVLEAQYLYKDKKSDLVHYLYIPSLTPCSDDQTLKGMVMELSRQNTVTDPKLENQVLWALMRDFQPKTFLELLSGAQEPSQPPTPQGARTGAPGAQAKQPAQDDAAARPLPKPPMPPAPAPRAPAAAMPPPPAPQPPVFARANPPSMGAQAPKSMGKGGFAANKKPEKTKKGFSLFGKKQKKEIVLGAAAQEFSPQPYPPGFPPALSGFPSPDASAIPRPDNAPYAPPPSDATQMEDATMLDELAPAQLRLAGDSSLPKRIQLFIEVGQAFTVGRHDVSVGRQQSSFEFDGHTKAVSRRHAAIERTGTGYLLVDLSSKAGTFLNRQRLSPNVPCALHNGDRVSFGTSGADYVWEQGQ